MSKLLSMLSLTLFLGCAGSEKNPDDTGTGVDADGDGSPAGEDCDDGDAAVSPTTAETCDGIDNDCDGLIDDADDSVTGQPSWYTDGDGDGFGDAATGTARCEIAEGEIAEGGDCDDGDAALNPEATEVCDEIDNDCDGLTDDADDSVDAPYTFYTDADGDGYGDRDAPVQACGASAGVVTDRSDYDDTDGAVWLAPDSYLGDVLSGFSTFCTGYGARRVEGYLDLSSATQADVDALSCITEVTEYVVLYANPALTNLDGLSDLGAVGGVVYVADNDALTDVSGLSALQTVGGYLDIGDNAALTNLDGLDGLQSVGDNLSIYNNAALTNVDGLSALTEVDGDLYIYDNPQLCQSSTDALLSRLAGFVGTAYITGTDAGC